MPGGVPKRSSRDLPRNAVNWQKGTALWHFQAVRPDDVRHRNATRAQRPSPPTCLANRPDPAKKQPGERFAKVAALFHIGQDDMNPDCSASYTRCQGEESPLLDKHLSAKFIDDDLRKLYAGACNLIKYTVKHTSPLAALYTIVYNRDALTARVTGPATDSGLLACLAKARSSHPLDKRLCLRTCKCHD